MENFSNLCRIYQDWRTRNRDYGMRAAGFVRNFAAEIATQIGAPETFHDAEGKREGPLRQATDV